MVIYTPRVTAAARSTFCNGNWRVNDTTVKRPATNRKMKSGHTFEGENDKVDSEAKVKAVTNNTRMTRRIIVAGPVFPVEDTARWSEAVQAMFFVV